MKLSNKSRYAIRALFDLAFHAGGKAAQIKDISDRQAIPPRFLEQIFQDLKRSGLVSSKRGPRGGYQLARALGEVRLGDIVRSVEGRISISSSVDEGLAGGDEGSGALLDDTFRDLSAQIEGCFDAITLLTLCERATLRGMRPKAAQRYVYVI